MLNEKDILIRLQNGEDAQKIADEIAQVINAANKTYSEQKAAEEAKKKNEIQKKEELQAILDMFADWFSVYYGANAEQIKAELTADQVIELVESVKDYLNALKGFESMFPVKRVIKSNTKPMSADETINQFLSKMGW
jgi:hypothetical protein